MASFHPHSSAHYSSSSLPNTFPLEVSMELYAIPIALITCITSKCVLKLTL